MQVTVPAAALVTSVPEIEPRGAARDETTVGSRMMVVASGSRSAPTIKATSNITTAASAINSPLPPSAHTTFVAHRFVVCTFVPRPFETDPGAIKIPFFHNNDDYDEVIFYHRGDFFSRDNIHPGMVTLHPGGFTHGPHPKALSRMLVQSKPATDEYAVMVDTRDALEIAPAAAKVEWAGYVDSWKSPAK